MVDLVPKLSLDDVGTRYRHLTDLLELWQLGLDVINKYNFGIDRENKRKLEHAIDLLKRHLDTKAGYDTKAINLLPTIEAIPRDPQSIKGGRGTPLRKESYGKEGKQPEELSSE